MMDFFLNFMVVVFMVIVVLIVIVAIAQIVCIFIDGIKEAKIEHNKQGKPAVNYIILHKDETQYHIGDEVIIETNEGNLAPRTIIEKIETIKFTQCGIVYETSHCRKLINENEYTLNKYDYYSGKIIGVYKAVENYA